MGLAEETDAEAVEATKRWYQTTIGKGVVGTVIASVILAVLGFGWKTLSSTTSEVMAGAHNGEKAEKMARKNRKRIKRIDGEVDELESEYEQTSTKVLQRLQNIQTSIDRNQQEYQRSIDQIRESVQSIRQHHYSDPQYSKPARQ